MNRITLVTGGSRSGKSRYALEAAKAFPRRLFVATAVPFDEEMKQRVAKHRAERGDAFRTVEETENLASALRAVPPDIQVVLIDCLTVWIGNLMHRYGAEQAWFPPIDEFLGALTRPPCHIILVTNEVGMGIVPEHPMGRRFRDIAGAVNGRVAAAADRVVFMVSGIPVVIKDGGRAA
ncbi:MAG: bifunctional adenosylcobinamide kinase/adenosylcobinamide-phosphate guanylyltransferase [Lentisphaerae bacterium]|nr:bifunctional adenosylcobinamide kinase/adenosylcobinamide-phosphate guanylyltransferase [Lentisphaerota bacterium]